MEAKISVSILGAGGRVAPLSQKRKEEYSNDDITLPKNELNSAWEAAKFVKKLKNEFELPKNIKILGWGDSTIALAWMLTEPEKLKTYQKNRVIPIQEIFGRNVFHIETKENPADEVSRGMLPSELIEDKRFFMGPAFLQDRSFVPTELKTNTNDINTCSISYMHGIVNGAAQGKEYNGSTKDRFIVEAAEKIAKLRTTKMAFALVF